MNKVIEVRPLVFVLHIKGPEKKELQIWVLQLNGCVLTRRAGSLDFGFDPGGNFSINELITVTVLLMDPRVQCYIKTGSVLR